MNCQNCNRSYNNSNRVPLLLIACGHSLCSNCAELKFTNGELICPECLTKNEANSINNFPKNLALINFKKPVKHTASPKSRRALLSKRESKP